MTERPIVWRLSRVTAGFNPAEGTVVDLDLTIHSGEQVAILGRSNSGRALLFRLLAGLRPIRGGVLSIFGHEMGPSPYYADWDALLPWSIRRRMGVLLDREGLLSNVSVREGLETLFRFKNGAHTAKHREGARLMVERIAERLDIAPLLESRPANLTLAERKLVGIARAFLSKPVAVLLEDPSMGFSDVSRNQLQRALEFIESGGSRTLILATEDLRLASRFCTRWIVMDEGKLLFDGSKEDFLKSSSVYAEHCRNSLWARSGDKQRSVA